MLIGFLMFLMFFVGVFLILLVLVQKGKGGGLAGAFGGMGGQSAFGTKAGDMFTKITMGTAVFWILLCALTTRLMMYDPLAVGSESSGAEVTAPFDKEGKAGDGKTETGTPATGKSSTPASGKSAAGTGSVPAENPDAK